MESSRLGEVFLSACLLVCGASLSSGVCAQQDDGAGGGLSDEEKNALEEALGADLEASHGGVQPQPAGSSALQSMNPDIALMLDVAGAVFTADEPLQLGAHDPNKTGFTLQQLEMHIESDVDPFFRMEANIVFALFGVEVEEAFATTLALPWNLQARAGQFLTRFGRINATHPHAWDFLDQPLVSGKFFGSESSRGLGAELSWLAPLPWFVEVIASATDPTGECCARSFFGAQDPGIDAPEELLATTALKQVFPLGEDVSLMWGVSAQFGPNPTGQGNRTEIYGTDLYLRWRPVDNPGRMSLSLQVEAMVRQRQVPGDSLRDLGGYGQLVFRLDPSWAFGARVEQVTGVEDDPLDPDWIEARRRASAQITWTPSHFSRIRLQGSWDEAPDLRPDPAFALMLGLEVLVGAHAAHKY